MLRRRLKEPFGKAGLTVAILALVFALAGGAYAAGGLTKSQEKQVTKIAKKYAGKPGAPGATGPAGTNGTNGAAGKNGTNGKDGTTGFTKFLPSGSTETGTWSFQTKEEGAGKASISFNIPLAAELDEAHVHIAPDAECPGSAQEPKASPGNLCVYTGHTGEFTLLGLLNPGLPFAGGAGTAGAVLSYEVTSINGGIFWGTWAVTAAE